MALNISVPFLINHKVHRNLLILITEADIEETLSFYVI